MHGVAVQPGVMNPSRETVVDMVIRIIAGEYVTAIVPDVGDFSRHRIAQLPLHRDVPCVDFRRALFPRQYPRRHAIRPRERPIRTWLDEGWVGRALGKVEDGGKLVGRRHALGCQNWQVLRDCVAEKRTEHTDVVAAPVTGAEHSPFVHLIRCSDTRRPIESVFGISGQVNVAHTPHETATGGEIDPRPVARLVDRLRVDHVEAQPVIERQL